MQVLFAIVFFLQVLPYSVQGHGLMYDPEPRALVTGLDIGSSAGWPVAPPAGSNKKPCLNLPSAAPTQNIPYGTSKIKMRANAGANHVGPCKVFLVDPKDSSKTLEVGNMNNCMRSIVSGGGSGVVPAEMPINIPQGNLPCDPSHCVLRFDWTATHISVSNPELYDSCADVSIGGGNGNAPAPPAGPPSSSPTMSPSRPTSSPNPVPAPAPGPTPAPPSNPDTDSPYIKDSSSMKCYGIVPVYNDYCKTNCKINRCAKSHCRCFN